VPNALNATPNPKTGSLLKQESESTMPDSLKDDLERIRTARRRANRQSYSRLDAYRRQMEELQNLGASLEEIRIWLHEKARIEISKSAVSRAFKRWAEEAR
jgi:hypothetical protein